MFFLLLLGKVYAIGGRKSMDFMFVHNLLTHAFVVHNLFIHAFVVEKCQKYLA